MSNPLPEPSTPAAEAATIRDETQLRAVLGMPTDLRALVRRERSVERLLKAALAP